jgi:hypothetical protein
VESLDGIVVSNPDADHIGGFDSPSRREYASSEAGLSGLGLLRNSLGLRLISVLR